MTEEKIKKFINNPTSKKDLNDWFSCVNFIYTGDDCEYLKLSEETIEAIDEIKTKSKDDALVSSLVEIEGFDFSKNSGPGKPEPQTMQLSCVIWFRILPMTE